MIYNLVEYLRTLLPAETIYCNVFTRILPNTQVPDRIVSIIDQGGNIEANGEFRNPASFQALTRDIDSVKARKLAYDVKKYLHYMVGITLPAVTIDGVVYPPIYINQISANAIPQSLGFDENGRAMWTCNYRAFFTGVN